MDRPSAAARDVAPPSEREIVAAARALGGLARDNAALWRELSDPQVEAPRVARVLHADPGIAARVVKVANSAFYGRGRQVSSIDRAIVVLGLDAVRGIAAAAGLDRVVPRGVAGAAFAAHCAEIAALARALARNATDVASADAFLAGLLHDFGRLVAWRLAATGHARAAGDDRLHAHWGATVLKAWQLPQGIVDTVALHGAGGGGRLGACVRLAHDAAQAHAGGLPGEPVRGIEEASVDLATCGIDSAWWRAWLSEAAAAAVAEGRALAA